uniref:SAC domain-containing protein n=1 Tax=Ascaris lumbricoides TaxID=6252 RepID=A0A0M3IDC9_ASCLU
MQFYEGTMELSPICQQVNRTHHGAFNWTSKRFSGSVETVFFGITVRYLGLVSPVAPICSGKMHAESTSKLRFQ